MKRHNGSLELMIMLAIMRLEDAAYGVPISREIEESAGRENILGAQLQISVLCRKTCPDRRRRR